MWVHIIHHILFLQYGDGILATQAEDTSGTLSTLSTLDSATHYLANQTLQAETDLFVPLRKAVQRPTAGAGGSSATRKSSGLFAVPRPKHAISSSSAQDEDRKRIAMVRACCIMCQGSMGCMSGMKCRGSLRSIVYVYT